MRYLVLIAVTACTQRNPNVCCTSQEDCDAQGLPLGTTCASGLLCRGNQCIAESCTDASNCDSTAPYCIGTCQETCSADNQCPGFGQSSTDRFCIDGTCAECRVGMSDCPSSTPICDANSCRGCVVDDDCSSEVCDLDSGMCIDAANLLYVSPTGTAADDCSQTTPCTIAKAVTKLSNAHPTIRMLPGTYIGDVALSSAVGTIVATGATLTGSGTANTYALTTAAGGNMTIRGLMIMNPPAKGISCASSSSLGLVDVVLHRPNGYHSVDGSCHLSLLRSAVDGQIQLGGTSALTTERADVEFLECSNMIAGVVTVTNTIVRNGFALPAAAPGSASGRVSFSTINAGSLQCASSGGGGAVGFKFDNDIIFGVAPNVISGDDSCFDHDIAFPQSASVGTNMLLVDPRLVDLPGGNYHLTAQSPAIDAADPASTDVVDFEGTPRPQGTARDLGAFEYH